ncbi:MAG: adenylosuccinate lyase [Candidatus Omnitrophica bacterium 4484_213]|nr:MAG: adenylosuccinate lyase [Candidatus Omnitrophica bacterium 4484_213]
MIKRYSLPQIKRIWSRENKFRKWLEIEILVCEAQAELEQIPQEALQEIKEKARFDIARIDEIEKEVRHDVIAFLTNVGENIGEASRYLHLGLTSSDILDTSTSLLLKESTEILIKDWQELAKVLKQGAERYKRLLMIGRTHGMHAEPISFGFKLALFWQEAERNLERLKQAKEIISYGKISGAVGTYAHLDPYIEKYVCERLGLKPAPISSQILQRDRYAQFLTTLAIAGSSLEKFALEIRGLQRTEIGEVEEPFLERQKGSSAMPHKKNPVLCERICGLARVLRGNALVSLENIPLWHERDISHSSAERIVLADSTTLLNYLTQEAIFIFKNLTVNPQRMQENLEKSKGRIFSQRILLELIRKGLSREDAYKIIQKDALVSEREDRDFKELLLQNRELSNYLSVKEIESCFEVGCYLEKISKIFGRLGI